MQRDMISPSTALRAPQMLVAIPIARRSCQMTRKCRDFAPMFGVIRGIPVYNAPKVQAQSGRFRIGGSSNKKQTTIVSDYMALSPGEENVP